ncbi:aconitase/3-isopropylmalate dehydratase large subunit family protein [Streptacidiphilus sp. P02-A3a]|uniref:aconitase/3-isopropylmalate dehydratase large subunit family protein n=1 Tax=Streptacidiphilus sp. P02-A3a TaxID=2704468 RepID=UPI0015FD5D90|nr:aconitase/3-isopropylmalate dehydratase large subunit family protein [Streptacidiphilus sp. P02-A3a]QMU67194.1 homoaconitate hydratase family protein [Streptacidiphilus sp. P02-A3a]
MGMTMAEKILARHASRSEVSPGEYLWCDVDAASGLPLDVFDRLGVTELHNPERTYYVEDHLAPPPTVARANFMVRRRQAAKELGVRNYFEYGRHGILHQVFAENGMFAPGELVAMRDSHATSGGVFNAAVTSANADAAFAHIFGMNWFRVPPSIKVVLEGDWPPSPVVFGKDVALHLAGRYGTDVALYRSLEVSGPAVTQMSLSSRWTIANMGVELGAKFCLFEYDEKTAEFLGGRIDREFTPVSPDADASYERILTVDVNSLEPLVARPHDPGNVSTISEIESERISVDQAFIGSCTNGRLEDYAIAARILRGRRVHPDVRLLCSPASQHVWKEVLLAGLWEDFAEAGANIEHSTCGPCFGGHMGVMGDGEVTISSTNRNFQGRQGSSKAFVYLANPAVVAASAVAGYIADPRNFM